MKINIKVYIENNDEKIVFDCNAIYLKDKNIIKYQEKDKTNVTLNIKDNILIRENKEIYMQYKFIKNKSSKNKVLIKELNKEIEEYDINDLIKEQLEVVINTLELINREDCYEVKYELVDNHDTFVYKVIMEV